MPEAYPAGPPAPNPLSVTVPTMEPKADILCRRIELYQRYLREGINAALPSPKSALLLPDLDSACRYVHATDDDRARNAAFARWSGFGTC
jgi:hypothetical protein